MRRSLCVSVFFGLLFPAQWAFPEPSEIWRFSLPPNAAADEAIRLAIQDLNETGQPLGLAFEISEGAPTDKDNWILVGGPDRNIAVQRFMAERDLDPVKDYFPQGFGLRTFSNGEKRTLLIAGASLVGDVRGLYWLWDRIRVHKKIPDLNEVRVPALNLRVDCPWGKSSPGGGSEARLRNSLRYGFNWVAGPPVLDLVPWDSEPEATRNASNRERARELIEYAHSLHMKMFSFSHGFAHHPSLIREVGATLSPCDPKFWEAVREKYRKLLTALPELDGIEICNDDLSGFWDDYEIYDPMHETPECGWSYTKRFREFVKTVYDVVVGEFGKTYFHFTWSLVLHELTTPEVHREIFTDEIPTENFYLKPKITQGDRWWHQPYNRTFNLTPHESVVMFETMNYYEGGRTNIFPTFAGEYYQSGLQTFLMPEDSKVVGVALGGGMPQNGWGTREAYDYVLYRLQWNPNESIEQIAKDFCSIHFGPELAEGMAEIYLLSPHAYKYGLHIEPVSYGQFNSFQHMRVGTFPEMGIPAIDQGREHLEFWKRVYLRCRPWMQETLQDLDHGLEVAEEMVGKFQEIKGRFEDSELAVEIKNRLTMTRLLIQTNNRYVRDAFALFDYLEEPSVESKSHLERAHQRLIAAREAFATSPGFGYQLFGVDLLLKKSAEALESIDSTRSLLRDAPTRQEIEETVANQQARYRSVLEEHGDEAVLFGRFEAQIDGNDILIISGTETEIHHMRWDHPSIKTLDITKPLPRKVVTVIPKDIESRPLHPFVLEQPTEANDFTARIYFEDEPGGHGWVRCELYYVEKSPEELGLSIPWLR
ncbi:MAG: hypothetical protein H6751_07640 [Candidatus Omnitrophica bacterium]|nr:hypothetical protein [Candidatus Omnitrophota bacterium]